MKKLSIFCGALLVLCTTFILNSCNEEDNPLMRVQVKSKTVCAEKLFLLLDETADLYLTTNSDGKVTFESLDPSVATVDENGIVTAKGGGTTQIKIKINPTFDFLAEELTCDVQVSGNNVDLTGLTNDYEAQNGDILTGTFTDHVLTIADGAMVRFKNVEVTAIDYQHPAVKCLGDAYIFLDGDNKLENVTTGTPRTPYDRQRYRAVLEATNDLVIVGKENSTLEITCPTGFGAGIGGRAAKGGDDGCGEIILLGADVTIKNPDSGAGIGAGGNHDGRTSYCGDIYIIGGKVTVTRGYDSASAGIGSGHAAITNNSKSVCGNITIYEAEIDVTGGDRCPGIGNGQTQTYTTCISQCGNIDIESSLKVNSVCGWHASYDIGNGGYKNNICGTITIAPNVTWDGTRGYAKVSEFGYNRIP